MEEEQRLEAARLAEETALAVAEMEKAKCKAALEAAEAAKRFAELEAQKRMCVEMKAFKEDQERKKTGAVLAANDLRYRRYTIEEIEEATENFSDSRKIGEGGYGPVYKCVLDHTPVAIKVLRPDAAQGQSQFQQEVWKTASIIIFFFFFWWGVGLLNQSYDHSNWFLPKLHIQYFKKEKH